MKKRYDIVIAGTDMAVISDEEENYVKISAKALDNEITEILVSSQKCTKLEAALLCALSHLDGQMKAEAKVKALEKELAALKNEK